jgi:hypothetical protein
MAASDVRVVRILICFIEGCFVMCTAVPKPVILVALQEEEARRLGSGTAASRNESQSVDRDPAKIVDVTCLRLIAIETALHDPEVVSSLEYSPRHIGREDEIPPGTSDNRRRSSKPRSLLALLKAASAVG